MDPRVLPGLLALGVVGLVFQTRRVTVEATPARPLPPPLPLPPAVAAPPPLLPLPGSQPKRIIRMALVPRVRRLIAQLRVDDGSFATREEWQTGIQRELALLARNRESPPIPPAVAADLRAELLREYEGALNRNVTRQTVTLSPLVFAVQDGLRFAAGTAPDPLGV